MVSIPLAPRSRQLILSAFGWDLLSVVTAMKNDCVVRISDVNQELADRIINDVAAHFQLAEKLEFYTALAFMAPHRDVVGRSFMTVNRRRDYDFITPHSEGTPDMGVQIASFYCQQNSTDGGYTLLFNLDESGTGWAQLRIARSKMDLCGRPASQAEMVTATRLGIFLPDDALSPDDKILYEIRSPFQERKLFKVLSPISATTSVICGRDVLGYWDTVGSIDHSACYEFIDVLREANLLRLPPNADDLKMLDLARLRRVWRSGVGYREIFKEMIIHKLRPGELILYNNLTWAHGVSNWTPSSGIRRVAAAFA